MGKRIPAGVQSYDAEGVARSTKGKRHPDAISGGLEDTKKQGGSSPAVSTQRGGSTNYPSISVEDGRANLGTKAVTLQATSGGPGGSSGNNIPGDVSKYGGMGGSKSIKQP